MTARLASLLEAAADQLDGGLLRLDAAWLAEHGITGEERTRFLAALSTAARAYAHLQRSGHTINAIPSSRPVSQEG